MLWALPWHFVPVSSCGRRDDQATSRLFYMGTNPILLPKASFLNTVTLETGFLYVNMEVVNLHTTVLNVPKSYPVRLQLIKV